MPDNSSEDQKVITLAQLRYAVERLVQNNHGVINDLKFKVGDESTGVTVTESDDSEFIITRTDSEDVTHVLTLPVVGNRTVATLEDNDQEMHMKQWNQGGLFMTFPGIEPSPGLLTDTSYLGQVLTSRTFGFEIKTIIDTGHDPSAESEVWPGFFNAAIGTTFNFVLRNDSRVRSLNTLTFIDLHIRGNEGTSVDIEWSDDFIWPNGMPNWDEALGARFLIMMLGKACFVLSRSYGSGSDSGAPSSDRIGDINSAKTYAGADTHITTTFQWMLTEDDGQGYTVTKPIWYTGDGRFIDAQGSLIAEL